MKPERTSPLASSSERVGKTTVGRSEEPPTAIHCFPIVFNNGARNQDHDYPVDPMTEFLAYDANYERPRDAAVEIYLAMRRLDQLAPVRANSRKRCAGFFEARWALANSTAVVTK